MNNKLTKKQALIIEFINVYTSDHGRSPSYREIMTALGLTSVSAVAEHIENLVAKGALKRTPGAARSLEVVDMTYPETTELFRHALGLVNTEEQQILTKAAQILGLDLIPPPREDAPAAASEAQDPPTPWWTSSKN